MKKLLKYGILPLSVLALSVAVPQTTSVVHANDVNAVVPDTDSIDVEVTSWYHEVVDGVDHYDTLNYEIIRVPQGVNFVYTVTEYPGLEVETIHHAGLLPDDSNPDPNVIEYTPEQLEKGKNISFNKMPQVTIQYKKAEQPKDPSEDPVNGGNAENGGGTNEDGGTGGPATESSNPTSPTNSNNDSNDNSNASNTAGGSQGDSVNTNNAPTDSATEVPNGEPLRIAVEYLDLDRPINTTGYFPVIVNDKVLRYRRSLKPGESLTVNPKEIEGWKFEYAKLIGTDKIKGGIVNLPFTISYNDLDEEDGGRFNSITLYYSKIEKPSEEPKKPDVNPDLNGNNNTSNNSNNSSSGGQTQTPPTNTGGSNNSNNSNQLNNTNSSNTGLNTSLNTGKKPSKVVNPGGKILRTDKNQDSKMISTSKIQNQGSTLNNADVKDQTQNQGSGLSQADAKNQGQTQTSAKVTPKVEAEQTQAKATEKTAKTLPNTGESMPFLSVFVGIFSIFCLAWAELKHKQ